MSTLPNNQKLVTFSLYHPNGQRIASVKKAFIRTTFLNLQHLARGFLTTEDDTKWNLVVDYPLQKALYTAEEVAAIISYQVHDHGYYAVAKLYKKEKPSASPTQRVINQIFSY